MAAFGCRPEDNYKSWSTPLFVLPVRQIGKLCATTNAVLPPFSCCPQGNERSCVCVGTWLLEPEDAMPPLTPRTSASVRSARLLSVMEPSTFVGPIDIDKAGKKGDTNHQEGEIGDARIPGRSSGPDQVIACCRIEKVEEAGSGRTSLAVHAGVGGLVVVEAHRVRHSAVQTGAVALHTHTGRVRHETRHSTGG